MQIGKYQVEYLEDSHIYLVNGIILPSITTIISEMLGKDKSLESIPDNVLETARNRGNMVHKEIEHWEKVGYIEHEDCQEIYNYIELKVRNGFNVIDVEKIVILELDGNPIACGRLDQVIQINNECGINDIKSTYKLDYEYLYYQTNAYRIAHNQTYGTNYKKCYATHLRNDESSFKPILVNDEIVMQLFKDYVIRNEGNNVPINL